MGCRALFGGDAPPWMLEDAGAVVRQAAELRQITLMKTLAKIVAR